MVLVKVGNKVLQQLGFDEYWNTLTKKFEARNGTLELIAASEDELERLVKSEVK